MTHSLHRRGCVHGLDGDYVLLAMTSALNHQDLRPRLQEVAEVLSEAAVPESRPPGANTGRPFPTSGKRFIHAIALSSKQRLREALLRLKELDAGISITASGPFEDVVSLARDVGLKPHTVNLSMGIAGKKEKLAEEEVLEFTTMCGHALVAAGLVRQAMEKVSSGAVSPQAASLMLERPCVCGIFNLERSDRLLSALAPSDTAQ